MSKIIQLIENEYKNEYKNIKILPLKLYSKPKVYDAGGDLKKRWYVYFEFRNPDDNKMKRQTPIYSNLQKFKTLTERKLAAKNLCKAISTILENGFNPYNETDIVDQVKKYNIPDAIKFVLSLKINSITPTSYNDFRIRITQFEKWLLENGFKDRYITSVNKTTVINYLNFVLQKSKAKNRNNNRSVISMFFQTLVDNDILKENFVKQINVLSSNPERNKTYSNKLQIDIFDYLNINDKQLLLFIQFISYNYLRPVEVVRLKIKDINVNDKIIYVRAKNKLVKTKILPEILIKELPNLTNYNPETYLFTPDGFGKDWTTTENNKRGFFGKKFKKVKDKFNLGADYGFYSFRHTFITKLYKNFAIESTPFEAKSKLMLITGHTTMTALEKYLRDIDAVLPDDYSKNL